MRRVFFYLSTNILATFILLYVTTEQISPILDPVSEQSFALRYLIIATIVALLHVCPTCAFEAFKRRLIRNRLNAQVIED